MAISDDGATVFGACDVTSPGIYKSSQQQDALTSNTWAGPQSGTGDKGWTSIASDATGMNLVAGSYNAGRCIEMYFSIIMYGIYKYMH